MKFKELTKADIKHVKEVYYDKDIPWDERMEALQEFFQKGERCTRMWIAKLGLGEGRKGVKESEQFKAAEEKQFNKKKKYFLITWAQSNTEPNHGMLQNLEAYAKYLNAEILVIAGKYRNVTSPASEQKEGDVWHPSLEKYLVANRQDIHKFVTVLADVRIQPTASAPLNGVYHMTSEKTCIVGHPSIHLQTAHVLDSYPAKFLMTTGAITKNNFSKTRAGQVADFHHVYGAVIVEIKDDNTFFTRQITCDKKGNFIDLYYEVKDAKISRVNEIECLAMGDVHVGDHDEKIIDSTLNVLCKKLYPKNIVLHDLLNCTSINYHEATNPYIQYQLEKEGKNSLAKELDEMLEWLKKVEKYNVIVVRSNHEDFITRWLKEDWRKAATPKNSLEYMKFGAAMLDGKAPNGILPYIINQKYPKIKCLGTNEGLVIKNWEVGQHSHQGKSGSRGSLQQYVALSIKCILGHQHTIARNKGAVMVGTCTKLRVGYNNGPSNWINGHAIIAKNGKVQSIIMNKEGEFTTFK